MESAQFPRRSVRLAIRFHGGVLLEPPLTGPPSDDVQCRQWRDLLAWSDGRLSLLTVQLIGRADRGTYPAIAETRTRFTIQRLLVQLIRTKNFAA